MRRYTLMGVIGLLIAALIGVGIWWRVGNWQHRSIVNPDGSRIIYLGATYGRKHAIAEWKFQWGWPPIQRVVHRMETSFDTLYLWFRHESPTRVALHGLVVIPAIRPDQYMPCAVRLRDGRAVVNENGGLVGRTVASYLTGHSMISIHAMHFPGLPADGQEAELEFYTNAFFFKLPSAPRDEAPLRLTIRLPRSPLLNQVTKPEPLPAVRQKGTLRVRLTGFRWHYTGCATNGAEQKPKWWRPWYNEETLLAEPRFVLQPQEGAPQDWTITRMGFVPVGAGRPLYTINRTFMPPFITEVQGCWDASVYHFAVEFKNKRTGKYLTFDFWVPPPPFEQLRRQWQIAEESRKATAAKNYTRAIQVWNRTDEAFALEASYWRGYAYAMQGDYENAIREFRRVLTQLKTVNELREVRFALVCCLLLTGRRAEAAQLARDYIQQVYQCKEYLWGVDDRAGLMGLLLPDALPSDAIINARIQPWWKEAKVRVNMHLIDAIERIRSLQFARRGDYRKAIRELKAGRDSFQAPCTDALCFAWFYQKQGEYATAKNWLRQARAAVPKADHPDLWDDILLGRVLFPKEWGL